MNIFEDLIEELKEENLLEETVTEIQRKKNDKGNLSFLKEQPVNTLNEKPENFKNRELVNNYSEITKEITPPQLLFSNETNQTIVSENTDNPVFAENKPQKIESNDLIPETLQLFTNEFGQPDFANNFPADSEKLRINPIFIKKEQPMKLCRSRWSNIFYRVSNANPPAYYPEILR